jgi:S-adenosylmethionine:tRNA-ribosyltransferase-isomerase (queuine synthetase)
VPAALVYAAAIERGYTWHEFGDVTFFFPDERSSYVRMLRV